MGLRSRSLHVLPGHTRGNANMLRNQPLLLHNIGRHLPKSRNNRRPIGHMDNAPFQRGLRGDIRGLPPELPQISCGDRSRLDSGSGRYIRNLHCHDPSSIARRCLLLNHGSSCNNRSSSGRWSWRRCNEKLPFVPPCRVHPELWPRGHAQSVLVPDTVFHGRNRLPCAHVRSGVLQHPPTAFAREVRNPLRTRIRRGGIDLGVHHERRLPDLRRGVQGHDSQQLFDVGWRSDALQIIDGG
mmetsp:Transcript_8244/g.14908  ORF Transcript_8244/g.14908 Transcript_8244/m.14908 type:complete len:240 (-) Transcript_8244:1640-2359(-)